MQPIDRATNCRGRHDEIIAGRTTLEGCERRRSERDPRDPEGKPMIGILLELAL